YAGGWNVRAVAATLLGCGLAWGGLLIKAIYPNEDYGSFARFFVSLYNYAWFVGFFASGISYILLTRLFPPRSRTLPSAA
ncbi:MAG TPA: nitrate reductase, partial [Blastocatellia bacterium]|nr:nitrate reductase [Blastocatellia bacterium]